MEKVRFSDWRPNESLHRPNKPLTKGCVRYPFHDRSSEPLTKGCVSYSSHVRSNGAFQGVSSYPRSISIWTSHHVSHVQRRSFIHLNGLSLEFSRHFLFGHSNGAIYPSGRQCTELPINSWNSKFPAHFLIFSLLHEHSSLLF